MTQDAEGNELNIGDRVAYKPRPSAPKDEVDYVGFHGTAEIVSLPGRSVVVKGIKNIPCFLPCFLVKQPKRPTG